MWRYWNNIEQHWRKLTTKFQRVLRKFDDKYLGIFKKIPSAQGKWVKLQETIRKVHGKTKKEEKPEVNKHWFSEETIALIEERRSLNRNEANYEQQRKEKRD